MSFKAGVVGFRGYSGAELVGILARHPHVTPVLLEHRSDSEDRPRPRGHQGPQRIPCTAEAVHAEGLDVVFLCTPHEASMHLALELLETGARVIDLSAAFRLPADVYEKWYKEAHHAPALIAEAVYGLPEFYRDRIPGARLIANPGCYPTAANLAIRPLVESGVADLEAGIVCDAKSGVSGAGRKPSLKTSFCEVTENFSAYSLLNHRHVPEVLGNSGLEPRQFAFTAQLIPIHRGILETVHFRAKEATTAAALVDMYAARYAGEPFVRIYEAGKVPDIACVAHTNFCDIGLVFDPSTGRGVVVVAEDNLGKGAAGQAVQNMNLALGLKETEGLL